MACSKSNRLYKIIPNVSIIIMIRNNLISGALLKRDVHGCVGVKMLSSNDINPDTLQEYKSAPSQ